jgi:hypothetical protein
MSRNCMAARSRGFSDIGVLTNMPAWLQLSWALSKDEARQFRVRSAYNSWRRNDDAVESMQIDAVYLVPAAGIEPATP